MSAESLHEACRVFPHVACDECRIKDAAAFAPVSLTRIVADDSVRMIEWWADKGCPTPIDGDELVRVRQRRDLTAANTPKFNNCAHTPKSYADGVYCEFCMERLS